MVQNTYLKATVSKVKVDNNLKVTATTNGRQDTVSQKTQQSVQLLLRGVNRLIENINTINLEFAKHIHWSTLLTAIVANVHAVSHFKYETFSACYRLGNYLKGVTQTDNKVESQLFYTSCLCRTTHVVLLNLRPHCRQKVFPKRRKSP